MAKVYKHVEQTFPFQIVELMQRYRFNLHYKKQVKRNKRGHFRSTTGSGFFWSKNAKMFQLSKWAILSHVQISGQEDLSLFKNITDDEVFFTDFSAARPTLLPSNLLVSLALEPVVAELEQNEKF